MKTCKKQHFSEWGRGEGRCRERRYADHIFIQIYFRMHHFVVKFSKFSLPQAATGRWPPNQNPADALATVSCHSHPALLHYRSFTTTTAAVRRADTQNTKQEHQVTQAQRMLRAVMATRTRKCNANTDSTTLWEQRQDHEWGHRPGYLDLAWNLAIAEGANKVSYT